MTVLSKLKRESVRIHIRKTCRGRKCKHCIFFYIDSLLQVSFTLQRNEDFLKEALDLYNVLYRDFDEWYNRRQNNRFSRKYYLRFYNEVQALLSRHSAVSWNNAVRISILHRDLTLMWIGCQQTHLAEHKQSF
jgi:hypothetical protein